MKKFFLNAKVVIFSTVFICCVLLPTGCADQNFQSQVQTPAKPWTNTNFKNNPADFHFAIVADRTGGCRKGVFSLAVDKLNLLQPEFVMCVGDLVHGYTEDKAELTEEWDEFDKIISKLEMPFFFLPGNHDITNNFMAKFWEEKFGRRYYSFIYKNILFICLDTQDLPRTEEDRYSCGMTDDQIKWAKNVLAKNKNVRWTFVFMHQPLWGYASSVPAKEAETGTPQRGRGYAQIEEALGNRDYTVLAGHVHKYSKTVRNNRKCFTLATTGGGSDLSGTKNGRLDEVVWVTMTPKGPVIANIEMNAIHGEDMACPPEKSDKP